MFGRHTNNLDPPSLTGNLHTKLRSRQSLRFIVIVFVMVLFVVVIFIVALYHAKHLLG